MDIDASLRQVLHSLGEGRQMDRRMFLRGFALAGMLAGLGSCASLERAPEQVRSEQPTPLLRLRAAL